jgi:hypothetical protein
MLHIHLLRPTHGHQVLHHDIADDIVPITARRIGRNDLRHHRKRMTNNRGNHLPSDVAVPNGLIECIKAILPDSKAILVHASVKVMLVNDILDASSRSANSYKSPSKQHQLLGLIYSYHNYFDFYTSILEKLCYNHQLIDKFSSEVKMQ